MHGDFNGDNLVDHSDNLILYNHIARVPDYQLRDKSFNMDDDIREIIELVAEAGYQFSFVSNGASFPRIYRLLLKHRSLFVGVTFSLDGAREETHDRLRAARDRIGA
jgi:hypothetical protein